VLAIVDNHTFRRLACRVLDHDPNQRDVRDFFAHFKAHLDTRGLKVRGITTDGSSLYPDRQGVPRGRPSKANQTQARKAKRIQQRIADLFDHRHLLVQHHLTAAERKTFQRITRGLPHLRVLRQIMDEVYRLFDRRCRTETALDKLARLRRRVRRFKRVGRTLNKLFTPNLQKALTFLDDHLLPATSNAVERSNRRFGKAQRNVYSVRTAQHVRQRIALDMERDQRAPDRTITIHTLHLARAETG
jgi:beta-galactosidase/beta-glucuronidase